MKFNYSQILSCIDLTQLYTLLYTNSTKLYTSSKVTYYCNISHENREYAQIIYMKNLTKQIWSKKTNLPEKT